MKTHMPIRFRLASALVVLGAMGCGAADDGTFMAVEEAVEIAARSANSVEHSILDGLGYIAGDLPLAWRQGNFRQEYTALNFNALAVLDRVQSASGDWTSVRHVKSAPFAIMRVAAAGLDSFAVLGIASDRDIVVEHWSLEPAAGAVVVIGPTGATQLESLYPKTFERVRVFKGLKNHGAVDIEMDPEERFVLFATRNPTSVVEVRQSPVVVGATPVVLHTSATYPDLAKATHLGKFDHQVLVRVYVFSWYEELFEQLFVLADVNNDGIFDGTPLSGDVAFFEAMGLADYHLWTNLDH